MYGMPARVRSESGSGRFGAYVGLLCDKYRLRNTWPYINSLVRANLPSCFFIDMKMPKTRAKASTKVTTSMKNKLWLLKHLHHGDAYLAWSSKQPLQLTVMYPVTEDYPPQYNTANAEQYQNLNNEDIALLLITSRETLFELAGKILEGKRPDNIASGLLQTAQNIHETRRLGWEIDSSLGFKTSNIIKSCPE
jgi:hypothetical protein